MRLTEAEARAILQAVRKTCGEGARVRLFGSRLDPNKRGGDIDLLVELPKPPEDNPWWLAARIAAAIQIALGEERKVDVILDWPGAPSHPVRDAARRTGRALGR